MGKVSLEGLEFFAYHGYYEEEQKIGNKYAIDISVEADLSKAAAHDHLAATVNYEQLYTIIATEIAQKSRLLEHIGKRIIDAVLDHFDQVMRVEVTVSKFNPPIGGVCRAAKVSMSRQRND